MYSGGVRTSNPAGWNAMVNNIAVGNFATSVGNFVPTICNFVAVEFSSASLDLPRGFSLISGEVLTVIGADETNLRTLIHNYRFLW
jgi:hypothetical protein